MRPDRLELEGFTAFRERAEVDFDGAELFALTGPTGSGKTSLIDAITFALYGAVARYDDAKVVRDVISRGLTETKVRLDFSVGDQQYTAVRVVRATATGATTKEARLECGDEVLAADARAMTTAVGDLLGLGFGQFNTCVVLPQGDFARFLHEKRADRQDLLVALLDLGVYEEIGRAARQRAAAAQGELTALERELEQLADVDEASVDEAGKRVKVLERLQERINETKEPLAELEEAAAKAGEAAAEAERLATAVAALTLPDDVQQLAGKLARAAEAVDEFRKSEQRALQSVTDAQRRRDELPDHGDLGAAAADYQRLAELEKKVGELQRTAAATITVATEAQGRLKDAKARCAAAEQELDAARQSEAAHVLAQSLVPGEACPVCHQVVTEVPEHEPTARVDAARTASSEARTERERVEDEVTQAEVARQAADERVADTVRDRDDLSGRLGSPQDAATVARQLKAWKEVEKDVGRAQEAVVEARKHRTKAEDRQAELRQQEEALEASFHEARDTVVGLDRPPLGAGTLVDKWTDLARWAAGQGPGLDARREQAAREVTEAKEKADEIRQRIRETCDELGVDLDGAGPAEATAEALSAARSRAEGLATDLQKKEDLAKQVADISESRQVAAALGDHLRAERFEQWLLDEVIERLVEDATATLTTLSGGTYSLTLDEQGRFAVIDHANADTVRPARTLSGGETFLAALALALALAGQVAELSATGAPRLESILLDEGFGTLDAETLDTVAGALEELGAEGRTVGVVTHVRELAERLPVRFEVTKSPVTATVQRVDA